MRSPIVTYILRPDIPRQNRLDRQRIHLFAFGVTPFILVSIAAFLAFGMGPSVAMGQERAEQCKRLDVMRNQPLTDQDNQLIDACISAEVAAMDKAINRPNPDMTSAASFRQRMNAELSNTENTPDFKKRFVERAAALFGPQFAASETNPASARAMAEVLGAFDVIQTRDALISGIASPDATVRYLSAKALLELQNEITSDARLARETITALAKSGAAEKSGVAAGVMYAAVNYGDYKSESVDALVQMLAGRVDTLRQGGVRLDRGELPALRALSDLDSEIGNRAAALAGSLATLLRIHVEHYKPDELDMYEQAAVEETILETENLLKKIVRGSSLPDVAGKMQKGGDAAPIDMQIELNRWIGTAQSEGVLNAAPYSVPIGAP